MRDTTWMSDALCKDYDLTGGIDPFFPDIPGAGAHRQAQPAISICRDCPVRVECLAYARQFRIPSGVWGGVLRSAGVSVDRRREVTHGTEAGYTQHRRRGEQPCRTCVQAHTLAHAERRDRQRR